MNHGRSGVVALALVAVAVPLACGGSNQDAKASFGWSSGTDAGAATSPSLPPTPPPSSAPASAAGPLGTVYTADPNALAALLAAAAAAGSAWLGPGGAAGDPAEAGLRATAAKYAAGMTPDGQVAKGTLTEGGHIDFVVNMDPTKCYAIVAYGAGVADLDINLLAPPFYTVLAGQDGMAGPAAVIGAAPRPMCPVIPVSVPYKIDLVAKKGAGQVAAQLFSKPR